MRKGYWITRLTGCLVVMLCHVEQATGETPTLVTAFAIPNPANVSVVGKANTAVVSAFRAKYPDIRLKGVSGIRIQGQAAEAGLLMTIAGGTAPAVFNVYFRQSGTYIEKGFLYPLDEYVDLILSADDARAQGVFDADIMYRDEFERRVLPQARDVVLRMGPDGKKHLYTLPYANLVMTLQYNKVLFQKAGLNPDTDYPGTWHELWETAKKLTDREQGIYGFRGSVGSGVWHAFSFLSCMHVPVVEQDAAGQWTATFNRPGAAEAFDFFLQLMDGPWVNPKTGVVEYGVACRDRDAEMKWNRGEIAMQLSYIDDKMLARVNPDEIGLAPMPASPTGTRGSELNCDMMGLFAGIKDKRVRDAAWRYIRFYDGDEAQRIRTRVFVENGYGQFMPPDRLKRFGYEEYIKFFPKGWLEAYELSFKHGVPEPYGANCQTVYLRMGKPLEKALVEELPRIPDRDVRLRRLQRLLDDAIVETNEKMIGYIPDEEMRSRRIVAFLVSSLIFLMFGILLIYVNRVFRPEHLPEGVARKGLRKYWRAYLLLVPAVLTILCFRYVPLLRGVIMAFQDYSVMGGSEFVGFDNFALVLYDRMFWLSMARAAQYTALYLVLVFFPPIVLAVLLSEIPSGKVFLRVLYYLPAILSGIVMVILWKSFFAPDPAGLANQALSLLGIGPQKWLGDPKLAMLSIMIPQAWAHLGPGCLIYLAALKTVPGDLYEAAAIDGAGFRKRIAYVTLPTIRPLIMIQLIFALISSFQAANYVLVMTGGGPDNATHVVGLEIFYNAYLYLRFGIATSMGWIMGFALLGLTVLQMRRLSRMTFQTAGDR